MSIDDFDMLLSRSVGNSLRKENFCKTRHYFYCWVHGKCIKLRINAGDKSPTPARDKAIADAYGNKFIIPLDFEMLDSSASYYQAGLGNRLCYEITFNDYNQVINFSVAAPDAKYKITDISLEYEIVTQPNLQDLSKMNTKVWSCCMTEFSGINKFQ